MLLQCLGVCYDCLFYRSRGTALCPCYRRRAAGTAPATLFVATFSMPKESNPFLAGSLQALQENIRRAGPAATASYTLIGAILLIGGIGYGLDHRFETSPWFLLIGLLTGLIIGFYQLAKTVWKP